jgi:hypothetical protein
MKKSYTYAPALLMIAGILAMSFIVQNAAQSPQQPVVEKKKCESKSKCFPQGTATSSAECGQCHRAIYREYALGFGSDIAYKPLAYNDPKEQLDSLPARLLTAGSAHSIAGSDPRPMPARDNETGGNSCNVCHRPEPFDVPDLDKLEIEPPKERPQGKEALGITCAGCHLTPDGKIRGPYGVDAPHETVKEPKIKTAATCARCHHEGKRVVGKRIQTFLEWRDDFHKPGLGPQECQDCHMPGTLRKLVENEDTPTRFVARHLWTDGRSFQLLSGALSLVIEPEKESTSALNFHIINIGAGHSVPTGSNRRAIFLKAEVLDPKQTVVAVREWMFAPWYDDRPDDKSFLQEDKKRPDSVAAIQADAQGPHETVIRAGEERILTWNPRLKPGAYEVRANLVFDLNRYNNPNFEGDQTTISKKTLALRVK